MIISTRTSQLALCHTTPVSAMRNARCQSRWTLKGSLLCAGCIPVFVGPPFHAMPFARHVDYAASSVFINLTDTRKWFGKEKAQWYLNPRTQNKHKGKEGAQRGDAVIGCSVFFGGWNQDGEATCCNLCWLLRMV